MKPKTRYIVGATPVPKKSGFLSRLVVVVSLWLLAISTSVAQEYANIEYLCADWGPAMKLSGKTNEPPQFSDTEEEVYFLKQVGRFTRKTRLVPDLLSGSMAEDIGHGISIYLCKMKPDGGDKTEIKELWKNPNYPIDTQGQSTWMDVNERTRKIALAITYAGSDVTGLWTMNLDGRELKRIITPAVTTNYLQAINHPSWTPDGQWIVFEEELRGMNPNRFNIARCNAAGQQFARLLEATEKIEYMQPSVSPDGRRIAFSKYPNGYPGGRHLWLVDVEGRNPHQLLTEKSKPLGGDYPTWSPDGKRILITGKIVEAASGEMLLQRRPVIQGRHGTYGWPHWGELGIVGSVVNGILFTDIELREAKWIGSSKLAQCTGAKNSCRW